MYTDLKNKFSKFRERELRPSQHQILDHILNSTKPIIVVQAPVGTGKSLAGVMAGVAHEQFCYLASSIQLQDQLEADFPEVVVMKGRSNFVCNALPWRTAADCYHSKTRPCDKILQCDYRRHKAACLEHPYKVLNYSYLLHEANNVGKFSGFPVIIADEADVLESLITDYISLQISGRLIKELRLGSPKRKTAEAKDGVDSWLKWAYSATKRIKLKIGAIKLMLPDNHTLDDDKALERTKRIDQLDGLCKKLKFFYDNVDDTWILETDKQFGNLSFRPTWLSPELSEQFFFKHAAKFVLMSGTFPPQNILAQELGVDPSLIDFVEIPSTFPRKNNKIVMKPVANMSFKTYDAELPRLITAIRAILDDHPDSKGIIHAVSYKLANAILDGVQDYDHRLITHTAKDRIEVLDMFKGVDYPAVLISPSMERGVDLPDDLCRFAILAKCPYKSVADKVVSKRLYSGSTGNQWYKSQAAQNLVQACGRGVRSETDYCTTYLLDTNITDLIKQNRRLFPGYFIDCLERA